MKAGTLKPKHGYWDTTCFPIGGKFCRSGSEGLQVTDIQMMESRYKGCNARGKTLDGASIAFDTEHLDN